MRRPFSAKLRRLVKERSHLSNEDDIIEFLRSNHGCYLRVKTQTLRRSVREILDNDGDSQKKLLRSHDSEVSDGAVSTSEKSEPNVNLMNSMLRDSYKKNLLTDRHENSQPSRKKIHGSEPSEMDSRASWQKIRRSHESESAEEFEDADSEPKEDVVRVVVPGGEVSGPLFEDLGGMEEVLKELEYDAVASLRFPEVSGWVGTRPVSGILFHGPPGCGKTTLARAIANEAAVPFYEVSAAHLVSGITGGSEKNIRGIFAEAERNSPSIVFIDEIDAIASKREDSSREAEKRIVTELMTCMEKSRTSVKPNYGYVLVIGATNRPDDLDAALRRPGRFDREIYLGRPNEKARLEILLAITKDLKLEGSFDLAKIARSTPGYAGADLKDVANKAGTLFSARVFSERKSEVSNKRWWREPWVLERKNAAITMAEFEKAVKMVQPSSKREGFSVIPDEKWEDVGGLDDIRQIFEESIVRRIKCPEKYEKFKMKLGTGILLYGPPGCGKTLIAKAVANEAGANFIYVNGPELLSRYVGDSEKNIRTLFQRARTCSPCIIFFDEVDCLTARQQTGDRGMVHGVRAQLLVELDGAEQRQGVFVIGATNCIKKMDAAVKRPGRFGQHLYVGLPNAHQRALILQALTRKKPVDSSVDLNAIAQNEACEKFSGAKLHALVEAACLAAVKEETTDCLQTTHFEQALQRMTKKKPLK